MRRTIGFIAVLLVAAACGDAPLDNLGDVSRRVVHGTATTVTFAPSDGGPDLLPMRNAADVRWVNAGIGNLDTDLPAVVLNRVWERGGSINKFVQADPAEIVMVMPEIGFPEQVPVSVEYVTSQLVFDVGSGLLDADTAVAFGLWTAEPYSIDRREAQAAVLRVAQIDIDVTEDLRGFEESAVPDGKSLTWTAREFRYELFCRSGMVDDFSCTQLARSFIPLRIVYRDVVPPAVVTG